jgi:hypothetical protein
MNKGEKKKEVSINFYTCHKGLSTHRVYIMERGIVMLLHSIVIGLILFVLHLFTFQTPIIFDNSA